MVMASAVAAASAIVAMAVGRLGQEMVDIVVIFQHKAGCAAQGIGR
jgi:hypothetical protein